MECLRQTFFLPPPQADLSDQRTRYPEPLIIDAGLTNEEIRQAIWKHFQDKAPGVNELPNRPLRAIFVPSVL